jgi:SAM-dependent methyltransferase
VSDADREKWDARYQTDGADARQPSEYLVGIADLLPRPGTALDVAGGTGRNAIWLARHGLDVTVADISGVGLELAHKEAEAAGVSLRLVLTDLEEDPLPDGPFDVIVSVNFLRRPLFAEFSLALSPGGLLVYVQPTKSNLERNARPPADYLLEDGELPTLVQGLSIERYVEGWFDGRHEARLLARRPSV